MLKLCRNREAAALRERIAKAKEKRLLRTELEGPSLGQAEKEEDSQLLSAADWVKRSRIKEIDAKQKAKNAAEQVAKRLDEEEAENMQRLQTAYKSGDLKGLKIMHDEADFETGEQVILTLADSNILETDDDGHILGVNADDDVLENVNLADKDRRLEREKRAKRLKQPIYAAYDDDEFAEGVVPGSKQSILAQYDEEKKSGPRLVLGESGEAMAVASSEKQTETTSAAQPVTLKVSLQEVKDYYTSSEVVSFAKSKSGKEKKLRKIRKKKADDDDVGGAGSAALELERALLEGGEAPADPSADRGSRGAGSVAATRAATIEQQQKEARREGYAQALVNAAEKAKALPGVRSSRPAPRSEEYVGDEDPELQQALAKARRLALISKKRESAEEGGDDDDDKAALQTRLLLSKTDAVVRGAGVTGVDFAIAESKEDGDMDVEGAGAGHKSHAGIYRTLQAKHHGGDDELKFDEVDTDGRRADGTLIFTSTTEFTSRLQARLNEKARSRAEAAVKAAVVGTGGGAGGGGGALHAGADMEGANAGGWEPVHEEGAGDSDNDGVSLMGGDSDDDVEDDGGERSRGARASGRAADAQLDFVHDQPLVAKGMAATLALLKGSGELKQREELAGRAKDARELDPSSQDFGVKLEYRDEFGRKLTQKEAFRQLCYKFHGYGPSQMKKEKRLKVSRCVCSSYLYGHVLHLYALARDKF